MCARILAAVEGSRPLGTSDDTRIGISIGVGQLRGPASLTDALHEADRELYRCKNRQKAGEILS